MPRTKTPRPELPLDTSVGYQVRLTHRLVQRALQSRIEPHGVTLGMWYFLRALWVEDGLTQSQLSAEVGTMEPTTLSAVVAMEAAGFVRRERNAADRRKLNIFLTEKGRAMERTLLPEGIAVVNRATRSFRPEEKEIFLRLLKTMQADLRDAIDANIPARNSGQAARLASLTVTSNKK